jgi:protein-S-isoprenylcysteine O-methyltransferase Ste14
MPWIGHLADGQRLFSDARAGHDDKSARNASRNPIYLGDALALLGLTFWLDVVLGLAVVAGFVWVINERFVSVEEGRLQQQFPEEAGTWFLRVRRWI